METEDIELNELTDSLYHVFKTTAKEKDLKFSRSKHAPQIKVGIKGDESKIRQILMNLLVNAFKFTHQGEVSFGYSLDNDHYTLFVKDTGIGIAPEFQHHIFDRFYQVHNDDMVQSGTGLGLAITKGFVDFMGGQIELKSEINVGTEFKITLPLVQAKEVIKPENPKEQSNYKWNDMTILIAEDEESNYMYLEEILSPTGLDIIWAKNGKEAEEICKDNDNINLILMDIKMPIANGYHATKQIRKFRKDVPIIAQTAYALSHDRKKAMDAGCSDYITKPILSEDLFKLIKQHIRA
ncbi:ATP-binding response regulator [Marinifilum breve]